MKFGWDEDNEGGVVCGALALAILTNLSFMSHQSVRDRQGNEEPRTKID